MVRLLSETLSAKLELSALLVIIVLFCLLMVLAGLARATLMSSHDRGLVWCGVVWCGVVWNGTVTRRDTAVRLCRTHFR